jgi:hypothetical protein
MTDVGPPLKGKDIEELERKLDARLPAAYKAFLRKYNGGSPEPRYFKNEVLSEFFGAKIKDKLYDLAANHRSMRKWLPAEVIPIARDAFGNVICLAIRGKNRGKVYFWDHEGAPERVDIRAKYPMIQFKPHNTPQAPIKDDWPGHPDLSLIADNFAKFLDSFHDFDDEEAQAKPKSAKSKSKPSKAKPAAKQSGKKPRKSPKA